jgi:hypothetical protein
MIYVKCKDTYIQIYVRIYYKVYSQRIGMFYSGSCVSSVIFPIKNFALSSKEPL